MNDFQVTFIELALERGALRFGHFTLKSGRESPYFFNTGQFNDGEALATLGRCYAAALVDARLPFDMLFGPAYKGIPLVAATAIALADHHGRNVPYAFDRKEPKAHGEGGTLVGAPLAGRVVIVDDVISDGAAKRAAMELIRAAGAEPVGIVLALDREERGESDRTTVEEFTARHGIRCVSILTLGRMIEALAGSVDRPPRISAEQLTSLRQYRARYGVS